MIVLPPQEGHLVGNSGRFDASVSIATDGQILTAALDSGFTLLEAGMNQEES